MQNYTINEEQIKNPTRSDHPEDHQKGGTIVGSIQRGNPITRGRRRICYGGSIFCFLYVNSQPFFLLKLKPCNVIIYNVNFDIAFYKILSYVQ